MPMGCTRRFLDPIAIAALGLTCVVAGCSMPANDDDDNRWIRPGPSLDSVPIFGADGSVNNGQTAVLEVRVNAADPARPQELYLWFVNDGSVDPADYIVAYPIKVPLAAGATTTTAGIATKSKPRLRKPVVLTYTVVNHNDEGTASGKVTINP